MGERYAVVAAVGFVAVEFVAVIGVVEVVGEVVVLVDVITYAKLEGMESEFESLLLGLDQNEMTR